MLCSGDDSMAKPILHSHRSHVRHIPFEEPWNSTYDNCLVMRSIFNRRKWKRHREMCEQRERTRRRRHNAIVYRRIGKSSHKSAARLAERQMRLREPVQIVRRKCAPFSRFFILLVCYWKRGRWMGPALRLIVTSIWIRNPNRTAYVCVAHCALSDELSSIERRAYGNCQRDVSTLVAVSWRLWTPLRVKKRKKRKSDGQHGH